MIVIIILEITVLNVDVVFVAALWTSRVIIITVVPLAEAKVQHLVYWNVMKTINFDRPHSWHRLKQIKAICLNINEHIILLIIIIIILSHKIIKTIVSFAVLPPPLLVIDMRSVVSCYRPYWKSFCTEAALCHRFEYTCTNLYRPFVPLTKMYYMKTWPYYWAGSKSFSLFCRIW